MMREQPLLDSHLLFGLFRAMLSLTLPCRGPLLKVFASAGRGNRWTQHRQAQGQNATAFQQAAHVTTSWRGAGGWVRQRMDACMAYRQLSVKRVRSLKTAGRKLAVTFADLLRWEP